MKCAKCGKSIVQTSSIFCQSCIRELGAKQDNNTEIMERVEAWQRKNIRR